MHKSANEKISALYTARQVIQHRLFKMKQPPSFLQVVALTIFGAALGISAALIFEGEAFFLFGFLVSFGVFGIWSSLRIKQCKEDLQRLDKEILAVRMDNGQN